ncbi:MAG TPA: hypothetical protein VIW45_08370, partial [Vicinamibacterales bacterium]
RVFPGQSLERSAAPVLPQPDVESEIAAYESEGARSAPAGAIESQPGEAIETEEPADTEQPEYEPVPHAIDTTAELLGRATKRGTRARRDPAAPKKPAAKRTSARKPRTKKPLEQATE